MDDVGKMNDMEVTLFLEGAGFSPLNESTSRSLARLLARIEALEEFRDQVRAQVECEECARTFANRDAYGEHQCPGAPRW
jgi:hypothetical protein